MVTMGSQPTTQYARSGDVHIAYQVIGEGPVDLVWAYGLASNVEVFWDEPSLAAFFRRLAEFSRLIIFDRRGCGLSDRGGPLTTPTLEERADDILAVLDAVGSERASIFGVSEGGGLAALFASTHPKRTASIIVYGTGSLAEGHRTEPPAAMIAWRPGIQRDIESGQGAIAIAVAEFMASGWGTDKGAEVAVPLWAASMTGDEQFAAWLGRYARQSVSRNEIRPLLLNTFSYDLTDVFPAVRVPSLVLYRRDDPLASPSYGRHIASVIPDAQFVELDGIDHLPFVGDSESVASAIEEFLVGSASQGARPRRLVTLLFTDIVESTSRLAAIGDDAWRELLAAHDQDVRSHLARFGGEEVKHLGDGFLAAFDGPARAIRCALGIADAVERRGLVLRVAVHTGECEVTDTDVHGIAVHVGARLVELAEPREILASSTVRDLVAGSGVRFGDGRDVELSGVAGHRTVFPVMRQGVAPEATRRLISEQANLFRLDGEYWTVGYRGLVVTLRDSKGLRDISRLLAQPGREFHVLDLLVEGKAAGASGSAQTAPADAVIDDAARAQYKQRITDLKSQIDEANERGDTITASAAREELDTLVDALSSAYGIGGRPRRLPDEIERARKAVTRRTRDAMGRIERAHPPLGRHLNASIHTGVFCRYQSEQIIVWSTASG